MRRLLPSISIVIVLALVAGGCGDDDAATTTAGPTATTAAATTTAPAAPSVKIAIVRQLGSGDFFELWEAGLEAQAAELGVELLVYNAEGDNARQALDMETAMNAQVDAIIVDHGFAETMQPPIKAALDAGIHVITNAVDPGDERAVQVSIQDAVMAQVVLDEMVAELGGEGEVIYVYVAGYAPLDRRDEVWKQVKIDNPGLVEVAQIGVVNDSIAATVADQAKAALQANPNTVAIFAPFDEFTKGAALAVQELGMGDQVRCYGGDISTADIGVMTEDGSCWVSTASVDPYNMGAVTMRAAYLKAIGQAVETYVYIPPSLITRDVLLAQNVTNMEQLRAAFPELLTPEIVPIP